MADSSQVPWIPLADHSKWGRVSEDEYWAHDAFDRMDESADSFCIILPDEPADAWRSTAEYYEFRFSHCIVQARMEYDGAEDAKQSSKCVEIRIRGLP